MAAPHLVVVLGELQHLLDHLLVGAAVVVEVRQRQTVDPTLFVQVQQHLEEMQKMSSCKVTKSRLFAILRNTTLDHRNNTLGFGGRRLLNKTMTIRDQLKVIYLSRKKIHS